VQLVVYGLGSESFSSSRFAGEMILIENEIDLRITVVNSKNSALILYAAKHKTPRVMSVNAPITRAIVTMTYLFCAACPPTVVLNPDQRGHLLRYISTAVQGYYPPRAISRLLSCFKFKNAKALSRRSGRAGNNLYK
jgi:hypothetical protein